MKKNVLPLQGTGVVPTNYASLLLQQAASIGIWEVVIGANTIYWSDLTKQIHEVDLDFVPDVSQGLDFYKAGEHRDRITHDFNRALTLGEKYDGEYIIITATGKEKWVRSVGVPVFEQGRCVKIYGVFQDIDARKKAELHLRANERRFRKIFDFAPHGMTLADLKGNLLRLNEKFNEILGYDAAGLVHTAVNDLIHPEDEVIDFESVIQLLCSQQEKCQMERRFLHRSGEVVWGMLSIALVKDEQGAPSYVILQLIDISAEKESQAQILNLLEDSYYKNKKLTNFQYIVSHNLRSHTSNIEMLLHFLIDDYPQIKDQEVFGLVKDAFDNLQKTITNLSEISNFEYVDTEAYEKLCFADECERGLQSLSAMIKEADATITHEIDKDIMIAVVPEFLRSILLNLMTNAIKYRHPERPLNFNISILEHQQTYELRFSDNGLGIDLDLHRDRVFRMYKTFHRHPDARGLGLFIVKNQVEAMRGHIEIESQVNLGTTFKIFLKK